MPLQKRMGPEGPAHRVKVRCALMGHRGQLHKAQRQIGHPWRLQHGTPSLDDCD